MTVANTINIKPSEQTAFKLGKETVLDGVRGFAVLAVLGQHLKLPFSTHGALGVDVFFTLSGFLITVLLVEEWTRNGTIHLGHFYMRRILRLYPALLLMLLVVSFISHAYDYVLSTLTYTTNWVIALKIRPLNLELGHTWTLAIEEQYYLLWPLFLRFLLIKMPPNKVILFPLILGILSAMWRIILWNQTHDFWRYNAGTDSHADGLLIGSAFGLAVGFGLLPHGSGFRKITNIFSYLLMIVVVSFTILFPQSKGFVACVGIPCVVISTILLMDQLIIVRVNWLRKLFSFPILTLSGLISYGLYLWQVPVINLVNLNKIDFSKQAANITWIILIYLVCFLSYRYVERPILKLKKNFAS